MNIRDAVTREVGRAGDEDLTVPQLAGRATPRLPTGAGLDEVREDAEAVLSGVLY